MQPDFGLLTMAEVAKILHCSKGHISNIAAGKVRGCLPLPTINMGTRMLVRRKSLEEWVRRNEAANDNLKASPERCRKSA